MFGASQANALLLKTQICFMECKKMPSGQIQFHWHSQLRSQQVFKAYHVSFFQPFVGNRRQDMFNAMCQTNAL